MKVQVAMTAICASSDVAAPANGHVSLWSATALFRDDAERQELQITLNEAGHMTATLSSLEVDAFGHGTATLFTISKYSATVAATILLSGYDIRADRLHHLAAVVDATWTLDQADGLSVEVAGTALLTDIDDHTLTGYRAVPHHPCNNLDPGALTPRRTQTDLAAPSRLRPYLRSASLARRRGLPSTAGRAL